MDVQFKTHHDGTKEIEVIEFVFDTGARSVFPASEIRAGQALTYAQAYPGEYGAFKAAQARPQPEPSPETEEHTG